MTTGGWVFLSAWWGGLIILAIWCFRRLIAPDPPTHHAPTKAQPRD